MGQAAKTLRSKITVIIEALRIKIEIIGWPALLAVFLAAVVALVVLLARHTI
ncbi:hypothetical protein ACFLQW_00495 [Candidatus Zixiibacteriota bacterium]